MKTYVAKTKRKGKGLFTRKNFKKGDSIAVFKGKIYSETSWDYSIDENYILTLGRNQWLFVTNALRYLNHSCNPNASIKNRKMLVASRPILKDTEITIDYAFTEEDPYWKMECSCQEKKCRGLITGKAKF